MPNRFIVFDIWGDYAHFRKYYTTSSPLSFSIPPRTAVIGLVSAIIGLDKDEYLNYMTKEKAHVAVRIINPIKKIRLGMNLINTKDNYWIPVKRGKHEPRTQIRFELLKDPRYRIYFAHQNPGIHHTLKQDLIEHKSVYTPYLGISEFIGEFRYIGEFAVVKGPNEGELSIVNTVLPLDIILEAEFLEPGYKLFKERIPTEMIPGRVVTEYREVLYESEGKPIKAKVKEGFLLEGGECIVLL
jgi:CRISPR-associated protein Cas5h